MKFNTYLGTKNSIQDFYPSFFVFKNETNLDTIEKRNNHALKCIQIETQLIYANLEAFVYILSGLGNIQSKVSSDVSSIY
jgi:hypothetical protein